MELRSAALFSMILALSAATAAALETAADKKVFTPNDMAKMQSVSAAEISPDGSRIAYTLSVPRNLERNKDGSSWVELHVLDRSDGRQRPFVAGHVNVSQIGWTPDGSGISFVSKRDGDSHSSLYVIPIDGGESRKVAELKSAVLDYSWSPDGKRVAIVAREPEPADRKKLKNKGFSQEIYEEDFRHRRIYIVEAFSKGRDHKPLPVEGSAFDVVWGPQGKRLATAMAPTPLVDDSYMAKRVRIIDAESGELLVKLDNPGKLGEIAWSPDGQRLAAISAADINDSAAGRLMVASASGGQWRDILNNHEGHVSHIGWQDDEHLMYVNDEGVWTNFEKIRFDGSGRKHLAKGEGPALTSLSLSQGGQHAAFVASSPQHGNEVFTMSHGDNGPRRLTDSNPWLKDIRLAPQEVVRFRARDGRELEGILIRPLDARQGTRYPLAMIVHGGPEAHHRAGWLTSYSSPGQMFAARGIAAFYTNYRGSTGRGVAFSKTSLGDPAGKEFDDLVDAVDHLISIGLVDKDKVGVTGGSYGGYATAWCSTRYSDRFAAGVMFVGISNKISKVGTTDIPDEEYLVHALKRPWDNWQFFLERSPLYYAGRAKTPLLILHGKDDPRVNVGQSREMYRHMKLRSQAPVRLVLYPGEGHGNRRAASRLDYNLRAMRWMEHYLKGPGGDPPPYEVDYQGIEP